MYYSLSLVLASGFLLSRRKKIAELTVALILADIKRRDRTSVSPNRGTLSHAVSPCVH